MLYSLIHGCIIYDDYEYIHDGGWSSAKPYIGGLHAMTCQVKPDITPEEFWKAAYETGASRTIEKDGRMHEARIPVPEKLVQYLQKKYPGINAGIF